MTRQRGANASLEPLWLVGSVVAIVGVAVAVYSNSLHASFHFDDFTSIVDTRLPRDPWAWGPVWRSVPGRFLVAISVAVNFQLGGLDPFGYHLFNLGVHIAAGLAALWLARLLLRAPLARSAGIPGTAPALLAALVFVAHPLQTQSVTYVIQRCESMGGLFYLLALALYVARAERRGSTRTLLGVGSVLACALGLLSKETVASLPAAIVLVEVVLLDPQPLRRRAARLLPYLVLGSAHASVALARAQVRPAAVVGQPELLSAWEYLLTQFPVLVTYLRLLVVPTGQNLDHDFPAARTLGGATLLASLGVLLALGALSISLRRRWPVLAFCGLWFFVTLSVTSSFVPIHDVIFEHRLYLPVFGYGLFLSWASFAAARSFGLGPRGPTAALLGAVLIYGVSAHRRNDVWLTEISLWTDAAQKSPHKARPLGNLGSALVAAERFADAIPVLRQASVLGPTDALPHYNLGEALRGLDDLEGAAVEYRRAIELDPDLGSAHNNLANILLLRGLLEEAIAEYDAGLRADRSNVAARTNRGVALGLLLEQEQTRLRLSPSDDHLRERVESLLRELGRVAPP